MGSLRPAIAALLVVAVLLPAFGPTVSSETARTDGTAGATASPITTHPNTTAVLDLSGGPTRAATGTAGIDLAGAMAVDAGRIRGRFVRLQIDHRYAAAESASERRAAVASASANLTAHSDALVTRERRLRSALATGERSPRAALREFAAIGATARELDRATTILNDQAIREDGAVSRAHLAGIRADLVPLSGPVREGVARSLAGRRGPTRAVLVTDGSGLVLATVDGTEYVRSAADPASRNASRVNQFGTGPEPDVDAARDRASELYPWVFDNLDASSVGTFGGSPSLRHAAVYPVTIDHPQGTPRQGDLLAYLDGGTTDVFREVQFLSLGLGQDTLPLGSGTVQTAGPLRLQVNATRPGGPLYVNVTRSGRPVDVTVYANGDPVGSTGGDGQRWVLAPPGGVNVTAVDGDARVSVTAQV